MIEAVNSALANSVATRGEVVQASSTNSFAANPERIQAVAPAPYLTTKVRMDNDFDRAVLEFREAETGDVISQTPTEQQLQAYRKQTTDATIEVRDAQSAQQAPQADIAPIQAIESGGSDDVGSGNTGASDTNTDA